MSRPLPRPPKIVDLHAEALVDDIEAYDSEELLALAIDHLRDTLDAAIYWGMPEIRYIHGKGRGHLRNAVYNELRCYKSDELIEKYFPSYENEDVVVVVIGL